MTQATRACPYCSAPMNNPRRMQCGQPECKRAFNAERMREYQRNYKTKHGHYQTRLYDKPRPKRYTITCAHCGKGVVVAKATSRYCTHECFYNARFGVDRGPKSSRLQKAQRRAAKGALGTAGEIVWVAGICMRCGAWFTRRRSGTGVRHCSMTCTRRDAASRRRALEVGATVGTVSRWRVHERDGWTCHICGDPVDRDVVAPKLEAAVLDHVVPLARGGEHSEANLKTAHFYCNSVKRDLEDGWSAMV